MKDVFTIQENHVVYYLSNLNKDLNLMPVLNEVKIQEFYTLV